MQEKRDASQCFLVEIMIVSNSHARKDERRRGEVQEECGGI